MRVHVHTSKRGRGREGGGGNPKQALQPQSRAPRGAGSHNLEIGTRAEVKSLTLNPLNAPGAPPQNLRWVILENAFVSPV